MLRRVPRWHALWSAGILLRPSRRQTGSPQGGEAQQADLAGSQYSPTKWGRYKNHNGPRGKFWGRSSSFSEVVFQHEPNGSRALGGENLSVGRICCRMLAAEFLSEAEDRRVGEIDGVGPELQRMPFG